MTAVPKSKTRTREFEAGIRYALDNLMTSTEVARRIDPGWEREYRGNGVRLSANRPLSQAWLNRKARDFEIGHRIGGDWLYLPEDVEQLCRLMGWIYREGPDSE